VPTRPGARFVALVALVVVPLVVVGLLGEGIVRWRERHRATPPGTMPTLFYQHDRLRPALIHDRDYFGWIHTNSLGLRGRPVAAAKTPGRLRILADGGSTTFDATVTADDSTWPAHLERLLMARRGPGFVEVLNAGVPGYAVVDNLIRLQTELGRLEPDVVLLLQGHNDLYYALVGAPPGDPDTPGARTSQAPWTTWLSRHSLLYGKLEGARRSVFARWRTGTYLSPGRDPARADSALAAGAARFHRDLTSYVLIAKQGGARVVLIELVQVSGALPAPRDSIERAVWENAFAGVPSDVIFRGYEEYGKVMRNVAAEQDVTFIPTGAWGIEGPALYDTGDPIHLTDAGARRFAEHLAVALDSLTVLKTPSAQ
jgi:lysophospholipase L1-like esterase